MSQISNNSWIVAKALKDMRPQTPGPQRILWEGIARHVLQELEYHCPGFDARAFEIKSGLIPQF
jgi:hypothetical protein